MKGLEGNGLVPIIAQAIAEMEETHGEFKSIDEINLAELSRRTGLSRAKLRRALTLGSWVRELSVLGITSSPSHHPKGAREGLRDRLRRPADRPCHCRYLHPEVGTRS